MKRFRPNRRGRRSPLSRIREVKAQRKELQESERILTAEEARLQDNLDRDEQEILMIESWVEELGSAREKIADLRDSAKTQTEAHPPTPVVEETSNPVKEPKFAVQDTGAERKKVKARGRKGGLYQRFVH